MLRIRLLRTRLILSLFGLLAIVLSMVYAAVYASTTLSAERQARQQLEVGSNVFRRLLELRGRELAAATEVLVADFGFREAVATGDMPTIGSALLNQARRIGAEEALFFDVQGRLLSSSRGAGADAMPALQAIAPLENDVLIAVIDDRPFILVGSTVRAPTPIGEVAMAFGLDASLATEMQRLTGLAVEFSVDRNGQPVSAVSTFDSGSAPMADAGRATTHLDIQGDEYLATRLTLLDTDGLQVATQLYSPMERALAVFDGLKRNLLLITLVALALSTLAAWLLAGSLSRPVSRLASAARRIGMGDYAAPVHLKRNDELGVLAGSIDRMREEIASREQHIRHSALHDPLTGLPNLAQLRQRLSSFLGNGGSGTLTLVFMVDSEQLINAGGQSQFEAIVRDSAQRLAARLPESAMLGYQPGLGFLLLLDGLDAERAVLTVEELLQRLSKPLEVDAQRVRLQWLAGLVEWPRHGSDPDELIRRSGIAQADARVGQEPVAVYQSQRDQAFMRRVRLVRDIQHAAPQGELTVVYQPKLDLSSGEVRQVEALMRWNHRSLGFVPPDEFIILAEQTGSIGLLTGWLIDTVAAQIRDWHARGIELQVAMNISAHDLEQHGFSEQVANSLANWQIDPTQISFEVTESALMHKPDVSLRCLMQLRQLGISLAVDDYGTGYSSLATLKSLPVQDLKIDKSFVLQLASNTDDEIIVRSTIELAHNMGLRVVAEGIEDAASLDWLRRHGCDYGQGYFISRPVDASALATWLAARQAVARGEAQ